MKNKSLAEYNISLQPHFEKLKQQVASAYEEVNALKVALGKDVAKLGIKHVTSSVFHSKSLKLFEKYIAY